MRPPRLSYTSMRFGVGSGISPIIHLCQRPKISGGGLLDIRLGKGLQVCRQAEQSVERLLSEHVPLSVGGPCFDRQPADWGALNPALSSGPARLVPQQRVVRMGGRRVLAGLSLPGVHLVLQGRNQVRPSPHATATATATATSHSRIPACTSTVLLTHLAACLTTFLSLSLSLSPRPPLVPPSSPLSVLAYHWVMSLMLPHLRKCIEWHYLLVVALRTNESTPHCEGPQRSFVIARTNRIESRK